jgi:hypothetical protein
LKKQIKDIIDLKKCWLNDSNPSNKYWKELVPEQAFNIWNLLKIISSYYLKMHCFFENDNF